jgi:hypothetical protein
MAPQTYTPRQTGPEMVENQVGAVERVQITQVHCKKRLATFPSPAWMSFTKFSLGGNN